MPRLLVHILRQARGFSGDFVCSVMCDHVTMLPACEVMTILQDTVITVTVIVITRNKVLQVIL